ncbi:GGDEF domain-containing protein [Phytohalomonas tamaricis]|uniref:GGDEF domain-containing protein n=1 Tax=Phytohalomonas tamaricis TaxID=2081032 RepID=UPI00131A00EA|nr:GGDEF domain-containing protein [Phytohalomonas tamaricis]
MNAGRITWNFFRRLFKLPPGLSVQKRRQYETFIHIHLIAVLALALLVTPLAVWLGGWPLIWGAGAGLAGGVGALWVHQHGYINASVVILLSVFTALTLIGMLTYGMLSGFDYYFLLIIVVIYLSDFSSLTKAICTAGFLLSMSGLYLYMHICAGPLSLVALDMHPLVSILNLIVVTLVAGAMLTCVGRVARHLEYLYRNSAAYDSLTGALNRRGIMAKSECYHRQGWSYAVMVIDVDYFKKINDIYGHACGDEVLRHLVKCMRESLREGDAIGRIGGEEFLVFLREMPLGGAVFIGERLRSRVEKTPCSVNGVTLRITVSVGIAVSGADLSLSAVIEQADRRLYQAKRCGRNRSVAHDTVEA